MQEWKNSQGLRKEKVWEMMWEAEFFEFAASAKGGCLTRSEAVKMWNTYLEDIGVHKDEDGPRGYKRCAIKTGDVFKDYEDMSRSQVAFREEKLGKKATEEDFSKKLSSVLGGMQGSGATLGNFNGVMHKAMASGGENLIDGTLTDPALAELLLRTSAGNTDEGDDDKVENVCAASSCGGSSAGLAGKDDKKEGWFSETQLDKTQRGFSRKVTRTKTALQTMVASMDAAIKDFQKEESKYKKELQLVLRRRLWLVAVLEASSDKLDAILKGQEEPHGGGAIASASDIASSKDLSSLVRAGPCAHFEQLKYISFLSAHEAHARSCTSLLSLNKWEIKMDPLIAVYNSLLSACKAALNDLNAARSQAKATAANLAKKQKEGA